MDTRKRLQFKAENIAFRGVLLILLLKHFFQCYFPLNNALCSNFSRIKHLPGKGFKRSRPCLLNEMQQSGKYPVLPAQENYDFSDLVVKDYYII